MTAVRVQLRESAQRALIEAQLAEGNLGEARRVYEKYHELLTEELAVSPSVELVEIVSCGAAGSLRQHPSRQEGTSLKALRGGSRTLTALAAGPSPLTPCPQTRSSCGDS
jgi:DNA-binding SARP family transcriptional activator